MEDDFDEFIGGIEALLARSKRTDDEVDVALKEMNDGITDLETKAERILNEGMKVIQGQHRAQARRVDQYSKDVDRQIREEAQQEAKWAQEDARGAPVPQGEVSGYKPLQTPEKKTGFWEKLRK